MVRLLVAVFVLALVFEAGPAPAAGAQSAPPTGQPPGEWVRLGPTEDFRVEQFAVSPQWPSDPFVIVRGEDKQSRRHFSPNGSISRTDSDIVRSADGGKSWDRVSVPSINAPYSGSTEPVLHVAPGENANRIVLARSTSAPDAWDGLGISRSVDGGLTWVQVLSVSSLDPGGPILPSSLELSPNFASDGRAFALYGGMLYRSQDYGATWASVHLVDGQLVQQIRFSPSFATDNTLATSLVTGSFPPPWGQENQTASAPHHETSAGVMISTDGGETWQAASSGLAIDGTPYRYVRQLSFSPTFAQDGVLFAFAWGPWADSAIPAAAFRSVDRGQTWSPVWQSPAGKDRLRLNATFALSPGFGRDGVGLLATPGLNSWNAGPHAISPCATYATVDSGQTWAPLPGQTYFSPGCLDLTMTADRSHERVSYSTDHPGDGKPRSKYRSFDEGVSWDRISPPTYLPVTGSWPSAIAANGAYFVGTASGLWMLPPPAAAAGSQP